jgi:hypothetical protein
MTEKLIEIQPTLGIGDIIMEKMKELSNDVKIYKINIIYNILKDYRKYPDKALENIKNLIKFLFDDCIINVDYNLNINKMKKLDLSEYPIKNTYIYDAIKHKLENIKIEHKNYIIFHTKVRIAPYYEEFIKYDYPLLLKFLKTFKTSKKIIISGEKYIEDCLEKKELNIISIYTELLELKKNNEVVDLTYDELYSGQDNFENFLYDIKLFNNADCNINIGIGGVLTLLQAFSKNNICYLKYDKLNDLLTPYIQVYLVNNNIYKSFYDFFNIINFKFNI